MGALARSRSLKSGPGKLSRRSACWTLGAGVALLPSCARETGEYPAREIRLIVQASPGGISDTVSRVIASLAEKDLGAPIMTENRPGAAGALAFSFLARQRPDGYVIGHAPVEIAMVRTLGYADVAPRDFTLLCLVSKTKPVLAVAKNAPWAGFSEFANAVRARPGYYVAANSGTGSIWHINSLLLEREVGLDLIHLPFGGSTGALTALLGNHVDLVVAGAGEVEPHVRADSLRTLAVFAPGRSALFPEAPSVAELGYSFGADAWSGFAAPAGLPEDRAATLETAIRSAFETPAFQRVCEERGMEPVFLPRAEFAKFAGEQAEFFSSEIPRLMKFRSAVPGPGGRASA
jgi:tripartite-type tricarboxylate transporter receptor subunit TctC